MTDSTSVPTHEQIAARAYEIFIERGRPQGRDLDHWLEAETQLRASLQANGGTTTIRATQSNGRSQTTARISARARK